MESLRMKFKKNNNNNQRLWYDIGYKQGVKDSGFFWTALITIALHNLYGWKKNFDKIEDEMFKLHQDLYRWREDKMVGDKLLSEIAKIRGQDYVDQIRKDNDR